MVEALALATFSDSLNDSDVRLRLREVSLRNATYVPVQIAVWREANRNAKQQSPKLVGNEQQNMYTSHLFKDLIWNIKIFL